MVDQTPFLMLTKPDFNVATWHDEVNGNFDILDSAVQGVVSTLVDLALFASGKPTANELLSRLEFIRNVRFPTNLTDSRGSSVVAATANASFTFKKNGVDFAAALFLLGTNVAVFSGTETLFVAGDILTIVAPSSQDNTLSDISLTITGNRED